jgi:predicted DNA-binding protein (MmcQ/YjbR family)
MPKADPLKRPEAALRKFALTFPETVEEFPWDHSAFKVKGKIFVILSRDEGRLNVTVKLPESRAHALGLPFAQPTGYGLGKHGWVTGTFAPGDGVPIDMLREWIAESFRAIAPKKLVAASDGEPASTKWPGRSGSTQVRRPGRR